MSQLSFSDAEFAGKRKVTRREQFLAQMERAIPWKVFAELVEPHYPKAGKGRRPYPLEVMLRIHFMQQWFNLSDPAMEEALYDSHSIRKFAKLSLARGSIPDETTILNFRHLLEKHSIAADPLEAPHSTIGVGMNSLAHTVIGTAANFNDVTQAHVLLHGEEEIVLGDAGYRGVEKREENQGRDVQWHIAMMPGKSRLLDDSKLDQMRDSYECSKASLRTCVKHPFRVIKCQFGFIKVRYQGLSKNTAQLKMQFMLANLWKVRHHLMAAAG